MTEKINPIPARLKNVTIGGHVAGAADIIDDELQMNQADINAIVLGGSINTSISTNKKAVFVGSQMNVSITASMGNVTADVIIIKKNGVEIGRGVNVASYTCNDTSIAAEYGTITYTAEFVLGGYHPAQKSVTVRATYPFYYGKGGVNPESAVYSEDSTARGGNTSTAGNHVDYNITTAAGEHLYFQVPWDGEGYASKGVTIDRIELVSTYPTELAFTRVSSSRLGYETYKNTEARGAGTYIYRVYYHYVD